MQNIFPPTVIGQLWPYPKQIINSKFFLILILFFKIKTQKQLICVASKVKTLIKYKTNY